MQNPAKMVQRSLLLMSSSRVHGYGYLEHAKEQLTHFLRKRGVKTVLFVPYALRDHDKYTAIVHAALSPWGFQVEGLHTKPDPVEAVRNAEAIFVGGGNTFVLLKTLYEKNLVEAIRGRVLSSSGGDSCAAYIGSSAGTNVATCSINTTNDMPIVYPPSFEALRLVPFNINPHYLETDAETKHKGETRDERLREFLEYSERAVLGLREGTALLVENDKVLLVGDLPAKLFRPKEVPTEYAPNSDLSFLLKEH